MPDFNELEDEAKKLAQELLQRQGKSLPTPASTVAAVA